MLPTHLNDFQTWLVDQRNAESPSVVIRAFNGFATFLDNLVTWFTNCLGWMTWVGVTVAGVLVSLRFGGARAAIWALAAFVAFAASGLWLESMQTLALMLAAVGLSLAIGMPLGVFAGLSDRFQRIITPVLDAMQIIPAFAYLMPIVILFSVGPGRGGDHDDDLRDPARDSDHGARHPRRACQHGRGRRGDGLDASPGARQGSTSARAPDAAALGEPDDPLRALDGRDRRADRRQGPRRRRHERPQLLSGTRAARRAS